MPTPTETTPVARSRTVTRSQLVQIVEILGLDHTTITDLHLNRDGGHAIVMRVDDDDSVVIDGDRVVLDVVTIAVADDEGGQR